MTIQLERTAMGKAFVQKAKPTRFLSGMFQTPSSNITSTLDIIFDIEREGEDYAVDLIRGAGGRRNKRDRFTTKIYTPPYYDEYTSMNSHQLMLRVAGQTEYAGVMPAARVIAKFTDDQVVLQDRIRRAYEVQAAEALQSGVITLVNGDSLDFKMKATHQLEAGTQKWSHADGKPLTDLGLAGTVIRADGKKVMKTVIFGATAWINFINNAQVKEAGDWRRINIVDINPPSSNVNGAEYHGTVTVGSYTIQCWTYPQVYDVPVGFGLANEGTSQPYIGAANVIVLGESIRLDAVFAGIPSLTSNVDPVLRNMGIRSMPAVVTADFFPYAFTDDDNECIKVGVRSAGLMIPTQIDGYAVIATETYTP